MRKKNVRLIGMAFTAIVTIAVILTATGCKKAPPDKPVLKIGLIVQDAVRPALVVAAEKLGYYEEEGVDIEFVSIDSVNSGLAAVETRKIDIFPFSASAISSLAKGSNHVFVGGVAVEGTSLVASPENRNTNFRDLSQWKGKKIGGNPTNIVTFQLLQLFKQRPDFDPEGFEFVEIDDNNIVLEAIKKGTVDAGFLTTERVWLAEEAGCAEAFDLAEFLPYYICCRLTANIKGVEENRAPYVAVLRALLRAEHDYAEIPDKIVDAVTAFTEQKREYVVRYIATEKDHKSGGLVNFKNPVSPDPLFNKLEALNNANIAAGNYVWTAPFTLKDRVDLTIYQDAIAELLERYPEDETYKRAFALFKENNSNYGL
ncbi:MAG: ABC transporter substrate-binding protein [Spirochaetaceae bacterium]|jgi:ABC-type nitrate/sulfonate/bicarbonate transport system substrate-binding protein|nr:ABC transporter substrate-binding protein [Spirochaetaceae bacterium]